MNNAVKQLNYTDLPKYTLSFVNWVPTNVHPDGWYFLIQGKVTVKLNHKAPNDINSAKERNKLTNKERQLISSDIEEFLNIDDTKKVKLLLPNGQTADIERVGTSWTICYRNATCLPYYCVDTLSLYTHLVDTLIPFASKDNL